MVCPICDTCTPHLLSSHSDSSTHVLRARVPQNPPIATPPGQRQSSSRPADDRILLSSNQSNRMEQHVFADRPSGDFDLGYGIMQRWEEVYKGRRSVLGAGDTDRPLSTLVSRINMCPSSSWHLTCSHSGSVQRLAWCTRRSIRCHC